MNTCNVEFSFSSCLSILLVRCNARCAFIRIQVLTRGQTQCVAHVVWPVLQWRRSKLPYQLQCNRMQQNIAECQVQWHSHVTHTASTFLPLLFINTGALKCRQHSYCDSHTNRYRYCIAIDLYWLPATSKLSS